jgi:hypothetical protein
MLRVKPSNNTDTQKHMPSKHPPESSADVSEMVGDFAARCSPVEEGSLKLFTDFHLQVDA